MLNKLAAIENLINKLLLRFTALILSVFSFFIPSRVKNIFTSLRNKIKNKTTKTTTGLNKAKHSFKSSLLGFKSNMFLSIDKFIKYSHQREFNKILVNLKQKIRTTSPDEYLNILKGFFIGRISWLKTSFKKLASSQTAVRAFSLSLIVTGAVSIYLSSNHIYKSENPNRAPASVQEYDYRPEYKSFQSRTLKIMNMKIPLEVESVREISSVTIDFTIRTTTRFSRLFLTNYEYKLKDYFFTTVEPVVSHFPLETEGKDVLKEKITEEVNNFLRENGVEGVVEEVEIVFMVAS